MPAIAAKSVPVRRAMSSKAEAMASAMSSSLTFSRSSGNAASLKDLFDVCVAEGFLLPIAQDIYLHADTEAAMRRMIGERLAAGTGLTVAEIRDLLGTTRKYAVPLCEYLDRVGVTRREGDLRLLPTA